MKEKLYNVTHFMTDTFVYKENALTKCYDFIQTI